MSDNVLLSTDIGTDIDDAVALYLAMNSPVLDLKGVYVTNGPVETRARIARRMVKSSGHHAEVAMGEAEAMQTRALQYTIGLEGMMVPGNDKRKTLEELGIARDWLSLMAEQLEAFGEVAIASIAPLTNIAKLLVERPEAAKKIKALYIMGGRENECEHNFTHDAGAARIVLDSALDTVVVSAEVCSRFEIEADYLVNLSGSRPQRYLGNMAALWKLHHDVSTIFSRPELRDMAKNRGAGYFDGSELFHNGLMILTSGKEMYKDAYRYLEFYKMFKAVTSFNHDNQMVKLVLKFMKEQEVKSFKVSDAFVIYAMEHPEGIEEKRVALSCDDDGRMIVRPGSRHRLVTDVDYRHFARFLKERLEKKQKSFKPKGRALIK